MAISRVKIIGSGLIGTSIALALAEKGAQVAMVDRSPASAALAQALVGGKGDLTGKFELTVIAIPPAAISDEFLAEISTDVYSTFIDVASVKSNLLSRVASIDGLAGRFCSTHPMAGREVGGPASARADLFQGRNWIVLNGSTLEADRLAAVNELISICGARAVVMAPDEHDRALALLSHLPQVLASILAAQLKDVPVEILDLAGQGMKDTIRIAGSDPKLWREIISANSDEIAPLLKAVRNSLDEAIVNINDPAAIEALIESGRSARNRIPGKHGGVSRNYSYIPIVIPDKAGQLGALFNECALADVNIEDLSIEHSPGQQTGLITLAVSPTDAARLSAHLSAAGWDVHSFEQNSSE